MEKVSIDLNGPSNQLNADLLVATVLSIRDSIRLLQGIEQSGKTVSVSAYRRLVVDNTGQYQVALIIIG